VSKLRPSPTLAGAPRGVESGDMKPINQRSRLSGYDGLRPPSFVRLTYLQPSEPGGHASTSFEIARIGNTSRSDSGRRTNPFASHLPCRRWRFCLRIIA
jgi:hypothetical protein